MSEQSFFQNALSNFTYEMASGGAIRHLTDQGYTVNQIMEKLDFPTPFERVQRQVWERLIETEVILLEEPGSRPQEKAEYVREYDKYGKATFRRAVKMTEETSAVHWRKLEVNCGEQEKVRRLLEEKITQNRESHSYAACEFGLLIRRDPQRFYEQLQALDKYHREYVEGLPWEAKWANHRLDTRMLEILLRLFDRGLWRGDCYFLKTEERVRLHMGSPFT